MKATTFGVKTVRKEYDKIGQKICLEFFNDHHLELYKKLLMGEKDWSSYKKTISRHDYSHLIFMFKFSENNWIFCKLPLKWTFINKIQPLLGTYSDLNDV